MRWKDAFKILAPPVSFFGIITKSKLPVCDRSGDKIKKNEMGGACSKYGGEDRRVQVFGGET